MLAIAFFDFNDWIVIIQGLQSSTPNPAAAYPPTDDSVRRNITLTGDYLRLDPAAWKTRRI
jgi:hypothetical protein